MTLHQFHRVSLWALMIWQGFTLGTAVASVIQYSHPLWVYAPTVIIVVYNLLWWLLPIALGLLFLLWDVVHKVGIAIKDIITRGR